VIAVVYREMTHDEGRVGYGWYLAAALRGLTEVQLRRGRYARAAKAAREAHRSRSSSRKLRCSTTRPRSPGSANLDDVSDELPDARDGLTRKERIVLWVLSTTQEERGERNVPLAMLYGRVIEHVDMSVTALQEIVARLGARRSS